MNNKRTQGVVMVNVTTWMSEEHVQQLNALADKRGRETGYYSSRSDIVRLAVAEYIERTK